MVRGSFTLDPISHISMTQRKGTFQNSLGKGEIAGNYHFLLYPQCFLRFQRQYTYSKQFSFVVCKCTQFEKIELFTIRQNFRLDWSKFNAFADEKFNIAKMMISLCNRVENVVGKKRKCWLPAFSPFPTMFSIAFYFRVVLKSGLCGKQLTLSSTYIHFNTTLKKIDLGKR